MTKRGYILKLTDEFLEKNDLEIGRNLWPKGDRIIAWRNEVNDTNYIKVVDPKLPRKFATQEGVGYKQIDWIEYKKVNAKMASTGASIG